MGLLPHTLKIFALNGRKLVNLPLLRVRYGSTSRPLPGVVLADRFQTCLEVAQMSKHLEAPVMWNGLAL